MCTAVLVLVISLPSVADAQLKYALCRGVCFMLAWLSVQQCFLSLSFGPMLSGRSIRLLVFRTSFACISAVVSHIGRTRNTSNESLGSSKHSLMTTVLGDYTPVDQCSCLRLLRYQSPPSDLDTEADASAFRVEAERSSISSVRGFVWHATSIFLRVLGRIRCIVATVVRGTPRSSLFVNVFAVAIIADCRVRLCSSPDSL